jgi:hypothetical protein
LEEGNPLQEFSFAVKFGIENDVAQPVKHSARSITGIRPKTSENSKCKSAS